MFVGEMDGLAGGLNANTKLSSNSVIKKNSNISKFENCLAI